MPTKPISLLAISALAFSLVTAAEPTTAPAAAKTNPLAAEDMVEVTVFQEPDLLTKGRISQAGTITFPLIGEIKIGGLSAEAAAQSIRAQLARDYLVNPQVLVTVTEYSKRRFTVLGQVQKPGAYEMPDRDVVSLLQAIGTAGGYTRIANAGDIKVKRAAGGKDVVFKLNAKNIASGKDPNDFIIQSGDIITVGESIF